jgi:ABC-2 type transport system ATP-binding protein/lipopolysaccharide transport system ATP-binding protein
MPDKLKPAGVGGHVAADGKGRVVIKALDGVSFELRDGDRVGLLGHNGSGKTTLLRVLAGIYEPSLGDIVVDGRVKPLFDLQLGMDSDQSGLENIWLRGRMLGLTDRQIKTSINDIAAFTQLENYLFMPVRTYSAGMLFRLGFAISTATFADILLLDEITSAGDAAFIESAHRRLEQFIGQAGVLVMASHNFEMLRQWCSKGLLLDHGNLVMFGSLEETIARYQELVAAR